MGELSALEFLLRDPVELREFVTPWGRTRGMTERDVYELHRRIARGDDVVIRRADAWWLRREHIMAQAWCYERDDAEWIASAYATVATAYEVAADAARRAS